MVNTYSFLKSREKDILQSIETLVRAESPSDKKEFVDQCGEVLTFLFQDYLGIQPEVIVQAEVGNHLKFTYGTGTRQILILAHFDTVWQKGRLSYRVDGDRIYGPGILDMKGGLVQALWAVHALKEQNTPLGKKVVFFCNSDEEIGSATSRTLIEEEARKSDVVLVVEPPEANTGALKTARKSVSIYDLKVTGRSAHAGNHHDKGISAIRELSRQIEFLESLTDYQLGTTVNVGTIRGGTQTNVVPEEAEARIDVRSITMDEAVRIEAILNSLTPHLEGTAIRVSGGINRPAMERTPETVRLFGLSQTIAKSIGFDITDTLAGGGSDGNFTAALGIPTLDGLGSVGDGPHAEYEHIQASKVVERTALLAELIQAL